MILKTNKTYKQLAIEFKRTKSERVFNQLYYKIKPGLFNYVNSMTNNVEITNDIVSSTLSKIYFKIDEYDETYQITTWAYKIAYNEFLAWLNYNKRIVDINNIINKNYDNVFMLDEESAMQTENYHLDKLKQTMHDFNLIVETIHALPELYKNYMIERFINQKSYSDIRDEMSCVESGVNLQTVKNRIFRGKKILNKLIKDRTISKKT